MVDGRVEAFKADIAEMRIKDPSTARETFLLRTGAVLMTLGVVVAIAAFFLSHSTSNALNQNDDQVIAIAGLAVTIAGAAVFLRYSLAGFLRFWLARLIFEQRMLAANGRTSEPSEV